MSAMILIASCTQKIFLPSNLRAWKNHLHIASGNLMLYFESIFSSFAHLIDHWVHDSLLACIQSSAPVIYFPVWSSDTTEKLGALNDF